MFIGTVVVLIVVSLWYIFKRFNRKNEKFPPGPKGYLLLGNAPQLDKLSPHHTLTKWAGQYGDVYTINCMGELVVVTNSQEAIWEVLVSKSEDFGDRKQTFRLLAITMGGQDILAGKISDKWKNLKTCTMRAMKLHSDGLSVLEAACHNILADSINAISETNQTPFDPLQKLIKGMANVMASLIIGQKFGWDNPDPLMIHKNTDKAIGSYINPNGFYLDILPILRFLPSAIYRDLLEGATDRDKLLASYFDPLMESFDPENIRGIFDALYQCHKSETNKEGRPLLSKIQVVAACTDLMMGGVVSTSALLQCLILILLSHKEKENKLVAEIHQVIGPSRLPTIKDRARMPYVQATLLEVLRYATPGPLNVPHCASKDSTIQGYHIPKGTQVLTNFWALNHDPRYWEDPWKFVPERFLDDTGELLAADHPRRRCLLQFGAGIRVCVGETMAKTRAFLFAAAMYQKFTFLPPEGETPPSCDPHGFVFDAALHPKPFTVRAVERNPDDVTPR